jgi:hypothetical protein
MIGQSRRARIEIELLAVVPGDVLRAGGFDDGIAAAQRPVASAGARSCLEYLRLVTGFSQLIGQDHAGDAGTNDDDAPAASRRQLGRPGVGLRYRQQAHRGHGAIGRGDAAGLADEVDQAAARQGWFGHCVQASFDVANAGKTGSSGTPGHRSPRSASQVCKTLRSPGSDWDRCADSIAD